MLERIFKLSENKTTVRIEILAGVTTFLTMAYIIVVQPAVLSGAMFGPKMKTGMDFGAITAATCISAALASAIMGLYARYPIAQAPGMGQNFFFVFAAIPAAAEAAGSNTFFGNGWQVALGAVFISGILFLILSLCGAREAVMNAISPSMKHAVAGGIGAFIAFIGLQHAGVILKDSGTAVKLNPHFDSPDLVVFFFGLILMAVLHARKVRGSILLGILGTTALAMFLKYIAPPFAPGWYQSDLVKNFSIAHQIVSTPPSLAPTFLKMDLRGALSATMWPFIIVFLFMVFFDTVGTLVGVSEQAGLMRDGKLPRAKQAFVSDALGTIVGAALGTSTVTSFIESAAGVEQGGRTGLTSVTVAILFLLALFFSPVIAMIGSYGAITAPALVLVGAMMMRNAAKIDWDDFTEAFPAFLVLLGIPLTYSIADGLALGFIAHPILKALSGRARDVRWFMYLIGALLVVYFIFVRAKMG